MIKALKSSKLVVFISIIVIFISYYPSLNNGITNWDDNVYITQNNLIKDFNSENLKSMFSEYYFGNYHPFTLVSYSIDFKLFNGELFWLHLHNLILHLINCLLVYYLIKQIFKNEKMAIISMLLFGIHPMHVESVAWISERKDVLYSMYYLLSLILFLKFKELKNYWYYFISLVFFIFSLLSKGQAVTLSVVLILVILYCDKKISLKNISITIPFLILSIFFGIIAILAQKSGNAIFESYDISYYERVIFAFDSLLEYFTKGIIPYKLSAIYPYPKDVFSAIYTIGFFALIFIFVIYKRIKNDRIILFALLFFIINIFPLLQFLPVGNAKMADRYFYIPSIGLFIIISYIISKYYHKHKTVILSLFLIYFIILGGLTYSRTKVWKDSFSLWSDTIEKYPESEVAWFNRGSEKNNLKQYNEALKDLNKAIELNPNYYDARKSRGMVLNNLGKFNDAILDLEHCLKINPNDAYTNMSLGISHSYLDKNDEALKYFNKALELEKNYAEALSGRGVVYAKKGMFDLSLNDFNIAININPSNTDIYSNRGILFAQMNKAEEALKDFNKAIELNPNFASAYINKGMTLIQLGNKIEACENFKTAFKLGASNAKNFLSNYCNE